MRKVWSTEKRLTLRYATFCDSSSSSDSLTKSQRVPADLHAADALEIAKRLATESIVLLKNDTHFLPLSKSSGKVAVIGPLADSPVDQMGTWVMDGRADDVQTPLAALREKLGSQRDPVCAVP